MRRILLTTDGSDFALSSARYLSQLYKDAPDLEVTVLNILPSIPPLYREGRHDPQIRKSYAEWKKKRTEQAKKYIEETIQILLRGGFKKSHIHAKHHAQVVGVARDIIREADAGSYDACVIAKKGMGWFDDMFLGSITNKILEISENHPIWVVSGNEWNSRKVLVAMDKTPRAVQLVRYVGEMLRDLEGVHITLYHYCPPFSEDLTRDEEEKLSLIERQMVEQDKEEMSHFFDEAQKVLEDLGYDKGAVKTYFDFSKSASIRKTSQAIIKQVRKGKYGTLVIGRKGSTEAREFRLGSVVLRTIRKIENCSVWVV